MPRCPTGRNRCNATNQCVTKRAPRPPRPNQIRFRCARGTRQCANRICYPSRLFAAPNERAANTVAALFRGRQARTQVAQERARRAAERTRRATTVAALFRGRRARTQVARERERRAAEANAPRQALMVTLAMSHERATDRTRLVALLQKYQYVIAVSIIPPPRRPAEYGELLPYVRNGRFEYVQQNFKPRFQVTSRRGNELFTAMQKHRGLPERIVCLDYFFLVSSYYDDNYGTNWLTEKVAGRTVEGKVRQILNYATDVYLPVDKPGDAKISSRMTAMLDAYGRLPTPTMAIQVVQQTPLFDSDLELGELPTPQRRGAVVSAQFMKDKWLDAGHPFIHIRSAV